jgi:hypothetical protein
MMSVEDFNGFCNGLLSAYLNSESGEVGEVLGLCVDYGIPPGSGRFNRALERVMSWLDRGDYSRLDRNNANSVKAVGVQTIIAKYGAQLGKDFSLAADGGLFINNDLLARMMEDLSPEQRGILEREAMGKTYPTTP